LEAAADLRPPQRGSSPVDQGRQVIGAACVGTGRKPGHLGIIRQTHDGLVFWSAIKGESRAAKATSTSSNRAAAGALAFILSQFVAIRRIRRTRVGWVEWNGILFAGVAAMRAGQKGRHNEPFRILFAASRFAALVCSLHRSSEQFSQQFSDILSARSRG
jgi:hypothetical protein